jgi:hypothetical protein
VPVKEVILYFAKSPSHSSSNLLVPIMYGPPRDCKEKRGREGESAQMYSAFRSKSVLLATMSRARVCPYKLAGCSFEINIGIRLQTRRCDCSLVPAAPVQTLAGNINQSS